MQRIKKSFADCSSCPLLNSKSYIATTSSKDNLDAVEIMIVGENPTTEDLQNNFPIWNTIFQEKFDAHINYQFHYFVTNAVLCQ